MKTVGSRAEVFHGNAKRTSGRLTKDDLMKNKAGRIVSKKKNAAGKNALKFLHAKGYIAVKGKFGSARVTAGGEGSSTASQLELDKLDVVPLGVGAGVAAAAVETGGE